MAVMRGATLLAHSAARIVCGRCCAGCISSQSNPAEQQVPLWNVAGTPRRQHLQPGPSPGPVFSAVVEEEIVPAPTFGGPLAGRLAIDLASRCDAIDRAVPVVGNQQRAVAHDFDIDRAAEIIIVGDEAGEEGLHRSDRTALV